MTTSPAPAAPPPRLSRLAAAALSAAAVAALLIHLDLSVRRPGTAHFTFDSAEYALAGRELAETGRLATPFIHPALLERPMHPPFPLLAGHPAVPVLNAAAFLVVSRKPWATILPAALSYVLAVVLCAALARRLGAPTLVALAAGGACLLSPWMLRFATEGRSEMPFAALFTLALLLLLDLPARPRPFALGVVLGLAHLTRPVMAPLLPAWIVAMAVTAPRGRRLRTVLLSALGFAPCAAALVAYKVATLGTPFADAGGYLVLASLTPELVVGRLNRMMPPPEPLAFLGTHPGLLPAKLLRALPSEAWQVAARLGRPLAALLVLRLFAPADAREQGLRVALFGCAALLLLLSGLTVPDPRMLFPLLPAFVAVAFDEARRLLESRGFGARGVALACAALLLTGSARAALSDWRRAARGEIVERTGFREQEWSELGERLAAALPPGLTVASDAAPWVAWYARRPATLVPLRFEDLRELEARTPLGALVITNEWLIHRPGEDEWRAAFEGRATPPGWVEWRRVAAGRLAATVFTRAGTR